MMMRNHRAGWLVGLLIAIACVSSFADTPAATDVPAKALHDRLIEYGPQFDNNVFGQPMYLRSDERDGALSGDVYARIRQPFATVRSTLATREQWCAVLILHLNVKRCAPAGNGLELNLGRKFDEPLEQTYPLRFEYRLTADSAQYLSVRMNAAAGPLGTRDYQITFEAIPTDDGQVFIHFRYAYAYGITARLAMQTYLSTLGRSKIGFSMATPEEGGKPERVRGTRGAIERNAIRYYLAIRAYLDSLGTPEDQRVERRLADWFAATERYPDQLHEVERDEYLKMKRSELTRMN